MRVFVALSTVLVLGLTTSPSHAQDAAPPPPCHPVSPTSPVVVELRDGTSLLGTLLCLTATDVVLAGHDATTATPLGRVRRIGTRADPVWDGAVKGAVIPVVFWGLFCHRCDSAPMMRAVGAYALIGLTWDSLDRNTRTIHAGTPPASINWRVRF